MQQAGAPVQPDDASGLWHSYQQRPDRPETAAFFGRVDAFLREALGPS